MPTEHVLEVHHLSKYIGEGEHRTPILTGVELIVKSAETIALIGQSGSGKSTLLGVLAGLDESSEGDVRLLGHSLKTMNEEERAALRAKNVGFVFQSFLLVPTLNALENVQLPALLRGESDHYSREQAVQLLARLGLEKRLYHLPAQLSGGEQQRVGLARAFSGHPRVLFADEPTGSLDSKTSEQVIEQLFSLNHEFSTALILVTHDGMLASRCQRRMRLYDGKLWEET